MSISDYNLVRYIGRTKIGEWRIWY
jgi:hypothetical protein